MEAIGSGYVHKTPTFHHLTTITSIKWPQLKPHIPNFTLSNPRTKPIPLFLTHCSTNPHTNSQQNPTTTTTTEDQNQSTTHNSRTQENSTLTSLSLSRKGLIFDAGPASSWDSLEIGSPVVKRYLSDDEERWHMWYHGRSVENPNSDSIGLAVSSNGVHWERGGGAVKSNSDVGLVMKSSDDWWAFDTLGVRPCEVVIMSSAKVRASSGVYWLYYTGFYPERVENLDDKERFKSLPGLAMSQDGRHWARIEGEHHSGALLDVGSEGEWDSSSVVSPQVVFHGPGDLRMYYHSYDVGNGCFSVGVARSRDGMRWVKLGKVVLGGGRGGKGAFDECGAVNARVLRDRRDGKYLMVYEGVGGDGKRSVGLAVSTDGLKDWRRIGDGPVLEGSRDGGWDCEGVGMPCLVQMDGGDSTTGEWRLYYRGIGEGGRTGIGLAVSHGNIEVNNFQRWTGFHL